MKEVIIQGNYGNAVYWAEYIPSSDAMTLFQTLVNDLHWQSRDIQMFGKTFKQPRLIAWMADKGVHYTYSKTTFTASPWHKDVLELKDQIEYKTGYRFNAVLINYYRDGNDSMGWHRDNEKEIDKDSHIASLSLGAERFFHFRQYTERSNKHKILLRSGSLLVMDRLLQDHWEHQLPKTKSVLNGRINLTFRLIKNNSRKK